MIPCILLVLAYWACIIVAGFTFGIAAAGLCIMATMVTAALMVFAGDDDE